MKLAADPHPSDRSPWRRAVAAAVAMAGGAMVLRVVPELERVVFIGGAARLASLFSGVPAVPTDAGWVLPFAEQPLRVTAACAATDFFVMMAGVLAWHAARRTERWVSWAGAVAAASIAAVPATLFVNALRLVAIAHLHGRVIPRMPEAYGGFLHMLTGVAVFLPALIAVNLLLEFYGRISSPPPAHDHP